MTSADGSGTATCSDPLPVGSRPQRVNRVLRALTLTTMVVLGTGVGVILAVIIGLMSGIILVNFC